jgi:hypothetical protein
VTEGGKKGGMISTDLFSWILVPALREVIRCEFNAEPSAMISRKTGVLRHLNIYGHLTGK